jgi:Flp pilus assembly protein TadD
MTPPHKPQAANMAQGGMTPGPMTVKPASFDSILAVSRLKLSKQAEDQLLAIENKLKATSDSSGMASSFLGIAKIYEQNKLMPVAGYYSALAAKLDNSEKMLTFAAQFFLDRTAETENASVQQWELAQAKDCFQRALTLSPDNDTPKIGLATCYVAMGETMAGVGLLREITQKDPDNIAANMLLGQLSIQSGQLDKAVARFETIVKKDPKNADAILYLAETYERKGEKAKATEWYQKAKELVDNPDFKQNVDKHINELNKN